jgi:diguanylate cyclase (GGDEF)-like protein/PAS domain S-box-containing protein
MNDGQQKYELALKHLSSLLYDRKETPAPAEIASDPDYRRVEEAIRVLRSGLIALGKGDLSFDIEGKGFTIGALKGFQGALRHLVWQNYSIAAGDYSQKVEFMGELSGAFNETAQALSRRHDELNRSEAKYRLLFENSAEAVLVVEDDTIQLANAMMGRLTGVKPERLVGRTFDGLFIEDDREVIRALCENLTDAQVQQAPIALRLMAPDGIHWLETKGVRLLWNERPALLFFFTDITQRRKDESALRDSEEKYRLMAENAQDVIWMYSVEQQKMTYVSPSVFFLRGYTAEEALREEWKDGMTPDSARHIHALIAKMVSRYKKDRSIPPHSIIEVEQYTKDGGTVCVEISIRLRLSGDGGLEVVGISRDVSGRKRWEEEILYLNHHDPLTNLHNRRYYTDQLDRLNTRENMPLSLVLADVNNLKLLNDAFGHSAGDELLIAFAGVLKNTLRTSDVAARVGGDEFVLLLPHTKAVQAERIVQRIRDALRLKSVHNVAISASFGIATQYSPKGDISRVYRMAEDNMYREKLLSSRSMRDEVLRQILEGLYEKSGHERRHSRVVSRLCMEIGREMGLGEEDIEELGILGLYHDIGKIALDAKILNKRSALSQDEMKEMMRHPEIGYQILRSFSGMGNIAEWSLAHHRRLDRTGYPAMLPGEMPFKSRILSVAEAFDMMTGDYPFRETMTVGQAAQELIDCCGSQFDQNIVCAFVERVLPGYAPEQE